MNVYIVIILANSAIGRRKEELARAPATFKLFNIYLANKCIDF